MACLITRPPVQVSYYKIESETFYGDSTLRQPDAVGVIEAQSNPSSGHYVGHWYPVRNLARLLRPCRHRLRSSSSLLYIEYSGGAFFVWTYSCGRHKSVFVMVLLNPGGMSWWAGPAGAKRYGMARA